MQATRAAQNVHRVPELWLPALRAHVPESETVLATIETDLDAQLQFARGLICLTDQGLYALSHTGEWSQWPLSPDQTLKLTDHAGIATLDLLSPAGRLACWRFTLAQNPSALRLVRQLDSLREKQRLEAGDVHDAAAFTRHARWWARGGRGPLLHDRGQGSDRVVEDVRRVAV